MVILKPRTFGIIISWYILLMYLCGCTIFYAAVFSCSAFHLFLVIHTVEGYSHLVACVLLPTLFIHILYIDSLFTVCWVKVWPLNDTLNIVMILVIKAIERVRVNKPTRNIGRALEKLLNQLPSVRDLQSFLLFSINFPSVLITPVNPLKMRFI